MDKSYFIALLHKYQQGVLTGEERRLLECYYDLFLEEPEILDSLGPEERKDLQDEMSRAVWDKIRRRRKPRARLQILKRPAFRIAAIFVLVLFVTGLYFQFKGATDRHSPQPLALVEKENRAIVLSDGSSVVLSAGSKLQYPPHFDGNAKREVYLEGQAFFDIQHNPSKPFVVHTGSLETIVLGTAFNVKALVGEKDITVTVQRGKVQVRDQERILGILIPSHQIVYNKETVASSLNIVDSDKYLDWQDQDLLIENLTVGEALKFLAERYKVNVKIVNQSTGLQRFTASFRKNESFEQALNAVCVFNDVLYKYNDNKTSLTITNQ